MRAANAPCRAWGESRRGFSLIDVLVTVSVISILIGLMLPTVAGIRETTRKVICASNARQIGLGVAMYADEHRGNLPSSRFAAKFAGDPASQPENLMMVRVQQGPTGWDGVGVLFEQNYLSAPGVYYCPSHRGAHPYRDYAELWSGEPAEIYANYHFRGSFPNGTSFTTLLSRFRPEASLVTDGLKTKWDFNHLVGANVVGADLRVVWIDDRAKTVDGMLAANADDFDAGDKVMDAWNELDAKMRQPGR